jgi:hypothetical protein
VAFAECLIPGDHRQFTERKLVFPRPSNPPHLDFMGVDDLQRAFGLVASLVAIFGFADAAFDFLAQPSPLPKHRSLGVLPVGRIFFDVPFDFTGRPALVMAVQYFLMEYNAGGPVLSGVQADIPVFPEPVDQVVDIVQLVAAVINVAGQGEIWRRIAVYFNSSIPLWVVVSVDPIAVGIAQDM